MRVLVAVDPTEPAEAIVDASRSVFGDDADRLVLTVVDPGSPVVFDPLGIAPGLTEELSGQCERGHHHASAVADDVAGHLDARAETRTGDPAEAICEAAEEWDADVIVIGAQHGGLLRRLLDPPVASAVLRRARRPVMVVPDPSEAPPAQR